MICKIIATGSSGNAVLLGDHLLLDCGVPYGKLAQVVEQLRVVALTHIHGDHLLPSTVKHLARIRPGLRWAVPEHLEGPLRALGVPGRCIDVCRGEWLDYGLLRLRCEPVPHDVPNACWHIEMGSERAIYAVDAGTLDAIKAPGYDLYLVEANHEEEELAARMAAKLAAGEWAYERRAAESHLSREQADAWLAREADPARSRVIYLHMHVDNDKEE